MNWDKHKQTIVEALNAKGGNIYWTSEDLADVIIEALKNEPIECSPYITQDGYDSGQAFVCEQHKVWDQVIGEDGRQTYNVTLEMFKQLVADHKEKFDG